MKRVQGIRVGAMGLIALIGTTVYAQSLERAKPVTGLQAAAVRADAAAQDAGGPQIACDEPIHDFGEDWKGTSVTHVFTVKNTGTDVLKISQVKPGCGCTVASEYTKEIAPGGTGTIPLTIDTSKVSTPYTKPVTVMSNDPTNGQYKLTMKGTLKERFILDPERGTNFGRIRPDEDLERRLMLTNNMDQPVELSLPAKQHGIFNLELVEKQKGQSYELVIRSQPPYAEQAHRRDIKLDTNLPGDVKYAMTLAAVVPPLVEATPGAIQIPAKNAAATTKNVRVRFNSKEPREVLSATTDVPNGEVSIKQITTNHYDLTVSLPANYDPGTAGHTLTVKTNEPKSPELAVKIMQPQQAPTRRRPAMDLAGKPIPDATFVLADGSELKTADMTEDATVMMFYASWCGYCKKALPMLSEMSEQLAGKSARFVAVSMDSIKEDGATGPRAKDRQEILDQWETLGVKFPQAFDKNNEGGSKFKVQSFPTMFLVSKGKVERAYIGATEVNNGTLRREVDDLVAGKQLAAQKVEPAPAQPQNRRPALDLAGQDTPDATFVLADGSELKTADMKDDATVVMFYASWCGYCKKALPLLNTMSKELAGKSAKFVAVSMDTIKEDGGEGPRAKERSYVTNQWKELGVEFPQAFDKNRDGSTKFKVQSFPTMFLLSKSGKVERAYIGGTAVNDGSLRREIDTLLAGKTLPPVAAAPAAPTPPQRPTRPALELEGKPAPAATFPAASGANSINLASTDSKATLAFFYASWCGYCKKALPQLNSMMAEYAGKPVKFVGINQDTLVGPDQPRTPRAKTREEVVQQWKDLGVAFEQHLDPSKVGRTDFKVTSFPTMFLIDANGKIDKVYVGGGAVNNGQLKGDIERLLKG